MKFIFKLFKKIYNATLLILLSGEQRIALWRSNLKLLPLLLKKRAKFKIAKTEELVPYLLYRRDGKEEILYFPKIYKLTLGGELKVHSKGYQLYEFRNTSFLLNSDFLRFNDGTAYCEKINRKEAFFTSYGDADLVRFDDKYYELIKSQKKCYIDNVFHMSSAYSWAWSHFLVQCFPRFEFINLIPKTESVSIVFSYNVDPHILEMTKLVLSEYPRFKIILCSEDTEIVCKKLYYVSTDTYLGDIGLVSSPFHIQITSTTMKYILEKSLFLQLENDEKDEIRLFIGRNNKRNIINYDEVLNYFKKLNFIEVFPHELNLTEKASIFSRAKYIVGPMSSGFTNIIFSPAGAKVLALINPSRHEDMYLSQIAKVKKIELEFLMGDEQCSNSNANYFVNFDELKDYVKIYWNL
jgi:capsular polysaccharide biosynthesis protein